MQAKWSMVVEHVNHFVQHALDDSLVVGNVLADDGLVENRVVPSTDEHVAHLADNVPPNVNATKRSKILIKIY